jgi:hypothetical protein
MLNMWLTAERNFHESLSFRVEHIGIHYESHFGSAACDEIEKIRFICMRAIRGRRFRSSFRMRMETTDHATLRSPKRAQKIELCLRIDKKTACRILGKICRLVNRERFPSVARIDAFDQAAALIGIGAHRRQQNCSRQLIGEFENVGAHAFGFIAIQPQMPSRSAPKLITRANKTRGLGLGKSRRWSS